MEQAFISLPRQPPVKEHRHGRQNDAAERIVLSLLRGGVADAHRPVVAIALEVRGNHLVHGIGGYDAVDRPHRILPKRCRE